MTLQDRFIKVAKLLGGDTPRWQAAAGAKMHISRGHMHHILTGVRPVTQQMVVKAIEAAKAEAAALRDRAVRLDAVVGELMPGAGEPLPMSEKEYQRQADEAEAIIKDMAGGANKRERSK